MSGNMVTAAQAGARWSYRLLPLLLLLLPMLYLAQELTVRVGVHTGRGYGELVRERFGAGCAIAAVVGLAAAAIGSLITEFTAVAGIGDLFGVSRDLTLPLVAIAAQPEPATMLREAADLPLGMPDSYGSLPPSSAPRSIRG